MSIVCYESDLIPRRYRGGVIPYYTDTDGDTGNIYFCFGVDRRHNEYTDFGGGIKKNESTIQGSLREFHEESSDCFGRYTEKDLKSCVVLYNHRIIIYFLPITKSVAEKAIATFNGNDEVSRIVSLSLDTLTEILTERTQGLSMYRVVKKCFFEIPNVEEFITMLKHRSL